MPKKRRFDFTKKNKRSGKVENVGYLDLEQDEEQSRCSLYFYGDIVSATWESMWYEEDRCPQDIADFLNQLDGYEDIDIYFNSGGGDVFAGLAIYNQLNIVKAGFLHKEADEADIKVYKDALTSDTTAGSEGEVGIGVTIPEDIRTDIIELRRSSDNLEQYVNRRGT